MKDEDDVPQNMEDFVFEVVKRAKEDEQRDEMAFNYSNQNRNKRKFILSPDGKWKRRSPSSGQRNGARAWMVRQVFCPDGRMPGTRRAAA